MSILTNLKKLLSRNNGSELNDIEELLLKNNFGIDFTETFLKLLKSENISSANARDFFVRKIEDVFDKVDTQVRLSEVPPSVILFAGSNGSGKTTTIAKVANLFLKQKKSVELVAADTFRSGALEQLSEWAKRLDIPIVKQKEGSDAASVVFDGLTSAIANKIDIVIVDTAGRVETKKNLIGEILKIENVIEKKIGRKPDETIVVIDAFSGQNALAIIETFTKAINITGIAISKFDGSSAPGIIVPIAEKYHLPVKFIGTGEKIDDIEYFTVQRYIEKII
ncbi:MAG: signal recognition particle-docking protein FtsY [Caldisericaceae bacterium]